MNIHIRNGTQADFSTIQEIELDGARAFSSVGYDFCTSGELRDEKELQRGLDAGTILIAETTEPIGFALVWVVDGRAHLTELAVRLDHQNEGVGFSLLEKVEIWAASQGLHEVTLTTFSEVPWNAPAYHRYGYRTFNVTADRPGLIAIQEEEKRAGFAQKPRVAMHKMLPC